MQPWAVNAIMKAQNSDKCEQNCELWSDPFWPTSQVRNCLKQSLTSLERRGCITDCQIAVSFSLIFVYRCANSLCRVNCVTRQTAISYTTYYRYLVVHPLSFLFIMDNKLETHTYTHNVVTSDHVHLRWPWINLIY